MGISYHEGKYKLAAGRYLDTDEVVAKIIEEASKRPSPKESGVIVLMSMDEFEAYQKLRHIVKSRAIEDNR